MLKRLPPRLSVFRGSRIAATLVCAFLALCCAQKPSRAVPPQTNSTNKTEPVANALSSDKIAASRKIIRNGELTLRCDAPRATAAQIVGVVEQAGGYIASSDVTVAASDPAGSANQTVTIVARIPAPAFDATLARLRALGDLVQEKIAAQDVTDEYVDVDARLRTQRALESQMLELLKEAKTVKDTLEVQTHLAAVRTELERLEGRQRVLDAQIALSSLTIRIEPKTVVADHWQVGRALADAGSDLVRVSGTVIIYGIRLAGVLLPLVVLVGVPIYGLVRLLIFLQRRRHRMPPSPPPLRNGPPAAG